MIQARAQPEAQAATDRFRCVSRAVLPVLQLLDPQVAPLHLACPPTQHDARVRTAP